ADAVVSFGVDSAAPIERAADKLASELATELSAELSAELAEATEILEAASEKVNARQADVEAELEDLVEYMRRAAEKLSALFRNASEAVRWSKVAGLVAKLMDALVFASLHVCCSA